MSTPETLPHWDLTPIYPALDSPEFVAAFEKFGPDIAALGELFDQHEIGGKETVPIDAETIAAFEVAMARFNTMHEAIDTLGAYIWCHVSVDTRDTLAQARRSEFQERMVPLDQLYPRFTAWIGAMDVEALIERSAIARDHAFFVRRTAENAAHLMSAAEEALAAEMAVTGSSAWTKLYGDVSSQIAVPITLRGEAQELPMPAIRNLAYDPDSEVRRTAYDAEIAAWTKAAVPLAAAMNSIKGEVNTLSRRRKWASALDEALMRNHIDGATLDAMLAAARESFPDFRRYLRAKAKVLGHAGALPWCDLFAPVGAVEQEWPWPDAERFIVEQFGAYSQRMSDFAARAFAERWIDAEPRSGKSGGAYCTSIRRGESRIFANFSPAFNGVSTIAHELGHAYHEMNLAHRTMLQAVTPMTLAETASIFCETIVRQAALSRTSGAERLAILEAALQGQCMIVVDITSRLIFEERVFGDRSRRELSVDELNAAMLAAQEETYGDGLDRDLRHPYMWAAKPHYYSTGSFYNFPYMFGQLFGLGLYARYEAGPEGFRASYDDLLSSTGLADAAALAGRFGIDIRSVEFWRSSLDIIRADITRFEELVAA
jgi:pepF/M3 family oligoendopeptidase